MAVPRDEARLEDILAAQPIGAAMFLPFTLLRLRGAGQEDTAAVLAVTLRDVGGAGETHRSLRLSWDNDSILAQSPAVQERTITEWAACGVACAVVSRYAGLRMRTVAADGDRFDYWVDDGDQEYGLEVSGTMSSDGEDVEARHRAKVRQLRENPYGVDGYVVVVGFAVRHVIFSFNRFEEEA